ncbi:MAG: hypothetical protein ACTSSQ_05210 [Alphaproteobacteria bacterium]
MGVLSTGPEASGLKVAGLKAIRSRLGSFGRTIAEGAGEQRDGESLLRNDMVVHSGASKPGDLAA